MFVDHLSGHAAVHRDMLTGDEFCSIGCKEQNGRCNIARFAYSAGGMLIPVDRTMFDRLSFS